MGTFEQKFEIAASDASPFLEITGLAGTGATLTQIPSSIIKSLNARIVENRWFEEPDGRLVEREVSEISVRLSNRVYPTIVVLDDEDAHPILGELTLAAFALRSDATQEKLVPMRLYAPSPRLVRTL